MLKQPMVPGSRRLRQSGPSVRWLSSLHSSMTAPADVRFGTRTYRRSAKKVRNKSAASSARTPLTAAVW